MPAEESQPRYPSPDAHESKAAGWQQNRKQSQFFAVVRHTERADHWSATVNGERWIQTEDFQLWGPTDPPLSDDGRVAAQEIGKRLYTSVEACDSQVHVVVSSPYLRCVQTAVEICRELGEGTRIILDHSLGEIYGPSVMGQDEPTGVTRPTELLLSYCHSHGVQCEEQGVGERPLWPEHLVEARRRFAGRFLDYLHYGTEAQRNFVLVSHADCVGAALRLMPSHTGQVLQRADFGAMFLAHREVQAGDSLGLMDMVSEAVGAPQSPQSPSAWTVETFDLRLRKRSKSGPDLFRQNLRSLARSNSKLWEDRVSRLLGELADQPLEEKGGMASIDSQAAHDPLPLGPDKSSCSFFRPNVLHATATPCESSGPCDSVLGRLPGYGCSHSFLDCPTRQQLSTKSRHAVSEDGRRQTESPLLAKHSHKINMTSSPLFKRRFCQTSSGPEDFSPAKLDEATYVIVSTDAVKIVKPEVGLQSPGMSALLQRRAGQSVRLHQ